MCCCMSMHAELPKSAAAVPVRVTGDDAKAHASLGSLLQSYLMLP